MQKMNNKCSVVVTSFDGYEDLWEPFFTLFFRYWPDCPYAVYLVTNYKTYNHDRVTSIAVGEHKGWASNIRKVLEKITTPYVICFHEDYFIEKPVGTAYIDSLVEHMDNQKIAHIRLFPAPPPDSDFPNNLGLGLISKGAGARTSLQAGLWDKKILTDLLVDGETNWQMESEGSKRSNNIDSLFLSVRKPALIYHERSAVAAGKWMYYAVRLCRREGIKVDPLKRRVDYFWSINQLFEKFRKSSTIKRARSIPFLGNISAKVARFLIYSIKKLLR